jgi:hypothetical protein
MNTFMPIITFITLLFYGPNLRANERVEVCQNFACKQQQTVALSPQAIQSLRQIFIPAPSTAADERGRIRQTIAKLEQIIGARVGTSQDIGKNYDPNRDYPGQLDCIAESTNTTRYLELLTRLELLQWHQLQPRHYRSRYLIDGHWTAVIEESASQQQYAVDSWYWDNGEPPEIQPLEDWRRRKRPTRPRL